MRENRQAVLHELERSGTTMDRIRAWIDHGEIELTNTEKDIYVRWKAAFAMMCNRKSPARTAKRLMELFSVSPAQAHRDVQNAIELFGDMHKSQKEGKRAVLYEILMRALERTHDVEQIIKGVTAAAKLYAMDKENPDEIPKGLITQNNNVLVINMDGQMTPFNLNSNLDEKTREKLSEAVRNKLLPKTAKEIMEIEIKRSDDID